MNLRWISCGNVTKWREKKASGVECNLASRRKRNARVTGFPWAKPAKKMFASLTACAVRARFTCVAAYGEKTFAKNKINTQQHTAALHFLLLRSAARFAYRPLISIARLAALYVGSFAMLDACVRVCLYFAALSLSRPEKGKQKQQLWIWHQIRLASTSVTAGRL